MNSRWTGVLAMAVVGVVMLLSIWMIDNAQAQVPAQAEEWPSYVDTDHGFGVRYPPGWIAKRIFENMEDEIHLIRRRVSFTDTTEASIVLDLWEKESDLPIDDWLKAVEGIAMTDTQNATVGGQQAFVLTTEGGCGVPVGVSTYILLGDRVAKAYTQVTGVESLPTYERMLTSFTLLGIASPEQNQTMLPDLPPLAPTTCGTNICPSTCWGECTFAARSEGCCGYHAVPRWQCSKDCVGSTPGEFSGNCVWWGAYTQRCRHPGLGQCGELGHLGEEYRTTTR